jgi:hypothetical protein
LQSAIADGTSPSEVEKQSHAVEVHKMANFHPSAVTYDFMADSSVFRKR